LCSYGVFITKIARIGSGKRLRMVLKLEAADKSVPDKSGSRIEFAL
jgi:hypothetical protein